RPPAVPRLRRQLAPSLPPRDRAAVRGGGTGGPERPRPAEVGPYIPERATREALRYPARVRPTVPPRRARARQRARRALAARQRPHGTLVCPPHVASDPRQLGPREPPGHAATPATAERPRPRGQHSVGGAARARAARKAPGQRRLRALPQPDRPDRLRAGELRRRGPLADTGGGAARGPNRRG